MTEQRVRCLVANSVHVLCCITLATNLAPLPPCLLLCSLPPCCRPGVKQYSVGSRFACLGVKFLEYSLAGITCGFIGQGLANSLMLLK